MGVNSERFSLDLEKEFSRLVDKEIEPFVKLVALEALNRITLKTPVLSGRARGNWTVTFGFDNSPPTDETDKSGARTISKGAAKISEYSFGQDSQIVISNNLPYINRLEHGYSKIKAPAGMIAVTIAELNVGFNK